jgi:DNA-binding CsgD family transcriptional regulator
MVDEPVDKRFSKTSPPYKKARLPRIPNIDEKKSKKGQKCAGFGRRLRVRSPGPSSGVESLTETLVDRIYECAFAPEHWPGVFDELAKIADARGGFLFTANRQVINWTASASLQAGMQAFVAGDFYTRSSRAARALASGHTGFLREHDIYTDDQLAVDPIYRDLLWPAGLGWAAAMAIRLPTGDELFLSLEREHARGPVEATAIEQLDALRPHLARAALMSARLQLERVRAASAMLASLGLPALVFDRAGRVLVANELLERPSDHLHWRAQDRFGLKDSKADALLRRAMETLQSDGVGSNRSFPVRGTDAQVALIAHVVPIRRSARDLFSRSVGVLILMPARTPQAPSVELVQSLFDLTAAEARVARSLTVGQTVDEIAAEKGISSHTVRTHVRGVLEKTGSRRQADVIALLGGIGAFGA